MLKSRNTTGVITVIGTSSGLTPDTLTLYSMAPDNSPLPFIWPPSGVADKAVRILSEKSVSVFQEKGLVTIMFPHSFREKTAISLLTVHGRKALCREIEGTSSAVLNTRQLGSGVYYLKISANGASVTKKIIVTP